MFSVYNVPCGGVGDAEPGRSRRAGPAGGRHGQQSARRSPGQGRAARRGPGQPAAQQRSQGDPDSGPAAQRRQIIPPAAGTPLNSCRRKIEDQQLEILFLWRTI